MLPELNPVTKKVISRTGPFVAISIGEDWIPEGDGYFRAPMSDERGITLFREVYEDGTTEYVMELAKPAIADSVVARE